MSVPRRPEPGFLAVTRAGGTPVTVAELGQIGERIGIDAAVSFHADGPTGLMSWGIGGDPERGIVLSSWARWRDGDLGAGQARSMLRRARRSDLAAALPPFAALATEDHHVVAATDAIGYRHLYVRRGSNWAAASTSVSALSALAPTSLDREALAVQSLLGWQLGVRTIYEGIDKVAAGHALTLGDGQVTVEPYLEITVPDRIESAVAVRQAASFLRRYLDAYLDQRPDATLQLSGGQDSRILLSAINPKRRRGLKAMTLMVPGSEDAPIAADLARREGLAHRVISMEGLEDLDAERAYELCVSASRRVSYMSNPLATAALVHAESFIERGPRIAGLGGEVGRGFYYSGPIVPWPVTRASAGALARWRLFTNESVPAGVLVDEFATWARSFSIDEVFAALSAARAPLWVATDEFYLYQRMQRWAGVTDSASCFERETVNPMLDQRFLDLARGLHPRDKQGSRFLGRLQVALDPGLAELPLDGRPAPEVYARGGLATAWTGTTQTFGKAVRKAQQRLRRERKPPAGGVVMAAKVLEYWRRNPEELAVLGTNDIVDQTWLQSVLDGTTEPGSAATAFLLNVATATADAAELGGTDAAPA